MQHRKPTSFPNHLGIFFINIFHTKHDPVSFFLLVISKMGIFKPFKWVKSFSFQPPLPLPALVLCSKSWRQSAKFHAVKSLFTDWFRWGENGKLTTLGPKSLLSEELIKFLNILVWNILLLNFPFQKFKRIFCRFFCSFKPFFKKLFPDILNYPSPVATLLIRIWGQQHSWAVLLMRFKLLNRLIPQCFALCHEYRL